MYKKSTFLTLGILLIFSSLMIAQTLDPMVELGKKLFFDKISEPDRMSCATCHAPEVGFVGPIPGTNLRTAIYNGAVPQRFGNRKPPSSAYATFSPIFHYDDGEGLFIGGNFWDGRATGERLGNPAADQALGPFLNPVEQNNASKQAVLEQVANSKYDYFLAGDVALTQQEIDGMDLFNGVAFCSGCHPSEEGLGGEPPLFTDFTFDNLGTPINPDNPFYDMDEVFINGDQINPDGENWIDPGLGGFLLTRSEWAHLAPENMGKHKVPTLRNVDKRPGNGFIKAYLHNGVFKSLKEVVHFYNTRDVEDWPDPEVAENINTVELGNLGLTADDEDAIVAFMTTLSDGYRINNKFNLTLGEQSAKLKAKLIVAGPNPFNPSTTLNYYLPEDAAVQLEVFNITGEKVATLQNGLMSAGEHQVDFNANNLATGIYIVSLYTGREIITVKLMLMK